MLRRRRLRRKTAAPKEERARAGRVRIPLASAIGLAGLLVGGCALVPGHSRVPDDARHPRPDCSYHVPDDYRGGYHYMSIRKANPLWWFMNADDPEVPDWYRPGASPACRDLLWHLRNPLHNFTYYVIGIADRPFVRCGNNPDSIWAREGRWNFRTFHAGPLIHLPGISYKGTRWEFYLGWRSRGNFGAALRRTGKEGPPPEDGGHGRQQAVR